jgi:lambda family phage portal protein
MKRAHRNSLRGRAALGLTALARTMGRGVKALQGGAMALAGVGGFEGGARARRGRRTAGWGPGEGSAAADIRPDLPELRGRSRDLERNHPLAHGAIRTKKNGVVGTGLKLRAVIDGDVLGITDPETIAKLQYDIEREWELFEAECDFTGQQHFADLQRTIYGSARVSGDIGIARRYKLRPGDTYGTKIVLIEADRISNPNRRVDGARIQAGVQLSVEGEVEGWWISDRHPGDLLATGLKWNFVSRRGASGISQMVLAAQLDRPGQVRGIPLFAPIIELIKQHGEYTAAEVKAAINDAYMFAIEKTEVILDDDGEPTFYVPDEDSDAPSVSKELALDDLTVGHLPPGRDFTVKKPERPNSAFEGFVNAVVKQMGAALDLPFEVLIKHFSSSFSAARGALEVAYKADQVDQAWLARSALDVVREWQFTEMVARGRFDAPGFFEDPIKRRAWLGHLWIGPTRVQINPVVEANADKIDHDMGTKTLEQIMTERTGGDFDTKARQIKHERKTLGGGAAAQPAAEEPPAEDDPNKQPKDKPDQGNGDEEE